MNPETFRASQELKAFNKVKKKTYIIQGTSKLLSPWMRVITTPFSLSHLMIKSGDKVIVSTEVGSVKLKRNQVLSSEGQSVYNHESILGNYEICDSGLVIEFGIVPDIIYFTIISEKTFAPSNNCNC